MNPQICTCVGTCRGADDLGEGWVCAMTLPPECPVTHPDNPVGCNPKPHCGECGGAHEPSGAGSDCLRYWSQLAKTAIASVEWARALLCSATPNPKLMSAAQEVEWCNGFGKWFAESHSLPVVMNEFGCAEQIVRWLQAGTYRSVSHRHTGTWRATDEAERRYMEADTFPLLADALLNWAAGAEPFV